MATPRVLGILCLSLSLHGGTAISIQRNAVTPSPSEEEAPESHLEPWELSEDMGERPNSSRYMESSPEQPTPYESPPTNEMVWNFEKPGQCFAHPLAKAYAKNWQSIGRNVRRGREQAKSTRVIFTGLIRNAGTAVRRSYQMFKRLGSHFKDYHFLLFESDSRDNTVSEMRKLQQSDPRYEFVSQTLNMPVDPSWLSASRLKKMAVLRGKVQDMVREFIRTSSAHWDLVLVYDFDLNRLGYNIISPHAILGSLGRQESLDDRWDMMCANSLRHVAGRSEEWGLWDCFAFRTEHHDEYNAPDCKHTIGRTFYSQYELLPVHSCFGGLAMYRPEKFLACSYDPDANDCEHVGLHKCMREQGSEGRMFMDPLLTTKFDVSVRMTCYPDENELWDY